MNGSTNPVAEAVVKVFTVAGFGDDAPSNGIQFGSGNARTYRFLSRFLSQESQVVDFFLESSWFFVRHSSRCIATVAFPNNA